jgi:hypothetical protein
MQTKNPESLTVSLDIGHSSIGWSVLEEGDEPNILGCGSLLFQADDCLASKRRVFRSTRRNVAAKRNRIARMAALLKHLGVFAQHQDEVVPNSSPWVDAARVIRGIEVLDWPRLWNVIRWYAHNRGYDGNKAWSKLGEEDDAEDETKRVQIANSLMSEHGTKTMAETICAMLGIDPAKKKRSSTKQYKTGDHAYDRGVVEGEVRQVLEAHVGKLHAMDDRLVKTLMEDASLIKCPTYDLVLRHRRGLLFGGFVPRFDNRLIPVCPVTGEKTPSKRRKEFYEYRWAMTLAGLRVYVDSGEYRSLNSSERQLLDARIREKGFLTKASLKKFLLSEFNVSESNADTYFLVPEMEKALLFDPAKKAIDLSQLPDAFHTLPKNVRRRIASRLNKLKGAPPASWLEYADDPEAMKGLMELAYDKAMKRKKKKPPFDDWINSGLDVARHFPSGRSPYARSIMTKAVQEVMAGDDPRESGGCLASVSEITPEKLSVPIDKQTNNHLIRHRLLLTEKLYMEIIKKYAEGDLSRVNKVVIETARDLREFSGKTSKEKQQIINGKLAHHRKAVSFLENERLSAGLNFNVSAGIIRKTRIALDMDWKCPFTGDTYDLKDILDGKIDVEHVIPRSIRPSDSLNGLVLTFKEVNRWKGNRTAFQFIASEGGQPVPGMPQKSIMQMARYESFVKRLKDSGASGDDARRMKGRKQFLRLQNFNERDSDFTPGDLTITSHLNRLATFRIRGVHKDDASPPSFIALPGSVTGMTRRCWRLLGCLSQANPRVQNEDGSTKTKTEVRGVTHLHHALDASVAAITANLIPNDGEVWRLLSKRRLTDREASFFADVPMVAIGAKNQPDLKELPSSLKKNLSERLAERRVRIHVPSRMGAFRPDENEYGVDSVNEVEQTATLHRGGKLYKNKKFGQIVGLKPTGDSKLESRKAVRLFEGNYGIWLGDPPEVIPMLRSWQKIQELKLKDPKAPILRNGDLIEVAKGTYKGEWRVTSIKNTATGYQLALAPLDAVPSKDMNEFGGKVAGLNSILKAGLLITARMII